MKKSNRITRGENPIDKELGRRLRGRRRLAKVSQIQLADQLGLTSRRIRDYERGAERIAADKLFMIAKALDAPLSYFFENLPLSCETPLSDITGSPVSAPGDEKTWPSQEAYRRIRSPLVRQKLAALAAFLAAESGDQPVPPAEETLH